MIEATFRKDSYGRNLTYKNDEAIIRQLYHLCVMKKGTDILNPDKGCDIMSYKYEFKDDSVIANLQQEITKQILDYTPYGTVNIICKAIKNSAGNYILHVFISMNELDSVVDVATDGEKSKLSLIGI